MSFWGLVQKMIPGLSGVDRLSAVFTAAFGVVSDGKMWRSLAWLVMGLLLIIAGLIWLAGGVLREQLPDAGSVASVAALAA